MLHFLLRRTHGAVPTDNRVLRVQKVLLPSSYLHSLLLYIVIVGLQVMQLFRFRST